MPSLRRGIGVPFRIAVAYVMSRIVRIVFHRCFGVELPDVAAEIAGRIKYIRNARGVRPQRTCRTQGIAVEGHSVPFRIHACQEHAPVGAAERTCADSTAEHERFSGKTVKVGSMHRICFPSDNAFIFRRVPERKGRYPELVREDIDYVRHGVFGTVA